MSNARFDHAVERLGAMHAEDPAGEAATYHARLVHWLQVIAPQASEAMRLAAHCQHVRRWTLRRGDFPAGVSGYKTWRSTLARFHADTATTVLTDVGYDAATLSRVRELLTKKGLKHDPEVQLFEDAVCLVFIETQLADFAQKHDDEKMLGILAKTWKKMTPAGHEQAAALASTLPARVRELLQRAIANA